MNTITLSTAELEVLHFRVSKANARLAKMGAKLSGDVVMGGYSVTSEPVLVTETTPTGAQVSRWMHKTTLTGEAPRYEGWEFIAALDVTDAGVLVHSSASGKEFDASTVEAGKCDHCKTNRVRRYTYIVSDGNRIVQVGKTCMKDFLGWNVNVPWISDDSQEFFDGLGGSTKGADYSLTEIMAIAFAVADSEGFVSSYNTNSTSSRVHAVLAPANAKEAAYASSVIKLDDAEVARRLDVVREKLTDNNEYERNLATALASEILPQRLMNLAISAVSVYLRRPKAEPVAKAMSNYMGTVGEKLEFVGTVEHRQGIDTMYGFSLLLVFNVGGNIVKCFTTANWTADVGVGDTLKLVGTVKSHDDYNGEKQTIVTRVKPVK